MIKLALISFAVLAALNMPVRADVTVKSQDGSAELTLPNGWREGKPLGPAVKISATDGRGSIAAVRTQPKEDFKDLQAFAKFNIERLKKNMPDAEPTSQDVQVNGKPAIRVSMTGTQPNGLRKGYVLTFLEEDGVYVSVMGSATASNFKSQEAVLAGIADRLKMTATAAAPKPATPRPAQQPPARGAR